MHPKDLSISEFTYNLPEERIAKYPLPHRDESSLLIYKNEKIVRDIYKNLADYVPPHSLLVFNNTKVVEARLLFQKSTGSTIELFCLDPDEIYPDITTAMLQKEKVQWNCLVGGAKKWKDEILVQQINQNGQTIILQAKKIAKKKDCFLIELSWNDAALSFAELLHLAGYIPLPPYLNRKAEEMDKERYQTIYAQQDGSVAAPTAGLHFTPSLFDKLHSKNIEHDFVTLHVGAGTFKPVKAATMQNHEMHAEWMDVSQELIKKLIDQLPATIIAVGTTSLRTIESLYWLGVKIKMQPDISPDQLELAQWDPYDLKLQEVETNDALNCLLQWMRQHQLQRLITRTQIIIAPGYTLKVAKALITNFHQPQSTLLLLIAAITGDNWKKIYQYALDHDFRFLSYGDGCLLFA